MAAGWALAAPLRARAVRGSRALDPRDSGAVGDGEHDDTLALQRAIDAAAERGGRVRFAAGTYRSGTLRLRSHVTLELTAGADVS